MPRMAVTRPVRFIRLARGPDSITIAHEKPLLAELKVVNLKLSKVWVWSTARWR